jgi:putative flippase GtrA
MAQGWLAGERTRIVRFALIGLFNTVFLWVFTWVMVTHMAWSLRPTAWLGYAIGMVISFLANRAWTFHDLGQDRALARAGGFIALNMVCALLFAEVSTALSAWLPLGPALVLATGVTTVVNFAAQRYLVFASPRPTSRASMAD